MGKATRVSEDRVEPTAEQFVRNAYSTVQVKDPLQATPIIVRRNLTSRNLERWLHRGIVDDRMFDAGDRYRSDYERANWQQRTTSCYAPVTAGGTGANYRTPGPMTEAQHDAWTRWRNARDELDPGLCWGFDMLVLFDAMWGDVPANEDRLSAWTKHRWVLGVQLCLGRLARYYRLQ